MGVSFAAKLAVGVPLNKVWEVRNINEKIIKYNPDTGVPYEATKSKDVVYFCGKPTDWETSPHEELESKIDLQIGYDHHEGNDSDWIIGKIVYTACNESWGNSKSIIEITPDFLEVAKKEVLEKLQKHGYTGEVGVYLISYVSY